MQVLFETATVTLNMEDVKQLFKHMFKGTQLETFKLILEESADVAPVRETEELWYPDDSGDWIEVTDTVGMKKFKKTDKVTWLLQSERDHKTFDDAYCEPFKEVLGFIRDGNRNPIVAVKKVR